MAIEALASLVATHPEQWAALKGIGIRGLAALAGQGIGRLVGSPEQETMRESLAAVGALQPEYLRLLEKQMAGEPTAATEAVRQQVAQVGRTGQQALATSARRAGQGGTEVARANQARFLAAQSQMLGQALGQAQMAAQQQVGALTSEARQTQTALAQQEAADIQELAAYVMRGAFDEEIQSLVEELLAALKSEINPDVLAGIASLGDAYGEEARYRNTGRVESPITLTGLPKSSVQPTPKYSRKAKVTQLVEPSGIARSLK